MQNKIWWRFFSKRSAICYFLLISLFFSAFLRVAVIAKSDYTAVLQSHGRLKLSAGKIRGTIYDCNMRPITNNKSKIIACVSPTNRAKTALSTVLKGQELESVLERLENGRPVLCEVPKEIKCDGIVCTTVYYNDDSIIAPHTVGYVNSDNKGVNGLELAYDKLLYNNDGVYFSFACDGLYNVLEGIEPEVYNNTSAVANGVVSTIDINIQSIIEETANSIERGAVVVADAKTLKIRGIVSRPNFNPNDLESYLKRQDSPLFNRAINSYAVGSAFKPCIAAAAIENGLENTVYNCVGSMEIIDRHFNCHERSGHGVLNLRYGLANSCNTYFFNLAIKTGKNNVFKMADNLNFGKKIKLCDGIYTANSIIPSVEKLENTAHLANFSIGQGDFTTSPVSMLTLYSAIANGGKYYMPSLVEGTYKDGKFTEFNRGFMTKAMSEKTAEKLQDYLKTVITEGTGGDALPETVSAAGKTATAQTGIIDNGREILRSWFCGFFPAESPKYIVIVFSEDSKKQTLSCGKIFSQTADKITALAVDKI